MFPGFTPSLRAGAGSPLVCLHGFMDTWRSWELVLPALERRHDVLALTLPGHAGGPPLGRERGIEALVTAVERQLDAAGIGMAHLVGNSLGGHVALRLAARGRATSVVALAPAGGWALADLSYRDLLAAQRELHRQARAIAPRALAVLATREGRRRATQLITTNFEHIPTELLAHQLLGVAGCDAEPLIEAALDADWQLDVERIACRLRFIWGTADELLPWPSSARRYREQFPQADWELLDGVGHCPQLDVPLEAAQLILDFTA